MGDEQLARVLRLMGDGQLDRVLGLLGDGQLARVLGLLGDGQLARVLWLLDNERLARVLGRLGDDQFGRALGLLGTGRLGPIPTIERPYSSLLAATAGEDYDQGTFGEVCGTRGCAAWHTCRLAGDAGWDLARQIGIPAAATLILRRSGCQVLPDWYSTDGHAVRRFIEVMAAREAQS
jgi:hypothetical protein